MSNSKVKHTPGPWVVEGLVESNGVGAFRIVSPDNTHAVADVYEIEGREANARLIAAAPEMLEALINARSLLETVGGFEASNECIQLSAIIEKATGGAE